MEVKFLHFLAYLFLLILFAISALNVLTLYDHDECVCVPPENVCTIAREVARSSELYEIPNECGHYVCREIYNKCGKVPKIIDLPSWIRIK